jgi:hypothetical protein
MIRKANSELTGGHLALTKAEFEKKKKPAVCYLWYVIPARSWLIRARKSWA